MEQDKIEAVVLAAVQTLYQEEIGILKLDVAERTICGRLASILQRSFSGHAVHTEYNRHGTDPKELELPNAEGVPTFMRVYPDIVVHQPGHDDENLIVMEIKKTTNSTTDGADLMKLEQIKYQIGYDFAAFLRLPSGPEADPANVRVTWV